jgi:protein PhnA
MYKSLPHCPKCQCEFTYENDNLIVCPECFYEWDPSHLIDEDTFVVLDCNGNQLINGDAVIIIKDLQVKGAPKPLKAGTKVKNIRIRDDDHNIDCKIEGFGSMGLKSEFVRKA